MDGNQHDNIADSKNHNRSVIIQNLGRSQQQVMYFHLDSFKFRTA